MLWPMHLPLILCVINLDNKYSKVHASYSCLLSSGFKQSFDMSNIEKWLKQWPQKDHSTS